MFRFPAVLIVLVAPTAADAQIVKPGRWEATTTILALQIENTPQTLSNMMIGRATITTSCVTPEQAKGGPQEALKLTSQCRYTRYTMTKAKFDGEMVCNQGPGSLTAKISGIYTDESYSSTGQIAVKGPPATKSTAMTKGRWLGPCSP